MSTAYPPNGSIISATVVQWDDRCLIAEDAHGLPYIHWYEDDRRWNNIWQEHMRSGRLPLKLRVGRTDGPRGRKAFIADLDMPVTVQQPQQPEVTRSPRDVFTALENMPLMPETVPLVKTPCGDHSSLNVRFETEQAAWIRGEARKRNVSNKEMAARCIKQAMAMQGAI